MSKGKQFLPKQAGVLNDLFTGQLSEEEVLKKWRVSQQTYTRWHMTAKFAAEYKKRLKLAKRKGELIMAKHSSAAANKLVTLMESGKEEVARRACLDVMNYSGRKPQKKKAVKEREEVKQPKELPPEIASKLLNYLVEDDEEA